MADVKSMLNRFEQNDNMSSAGRGGGAKPSVAAKPVMQRFQQMKENAATSNHSTTPTPSSNTSRTSSSTATVPATQAGQPAPFKLAGLSENGFPKLKPTNTNTNSNSTDDKTSRWNSPKPFQNGKASFIGNNSNNDNNNNNQDSTKGDSSTLPKHSGINKTASNSSGEGRPPIMPKFPKMSISNQNQNTLTTPPKPSAKTTTTIFPSNELSDKDKTPDKSVGKSALLPSKHPTTKTDSLSSNSSLSSSSSSSSSSSTNQNTNGASSSPTSPTPKSPPSSQPSPQSTNGVFDFKSQLRKVDASKTAPPGKRVLSGVNSESSSSSDSLPRKSSLSASSSNASTASSTTSDKSKTQSRVPPIPTAENAELRSKHNERPDNDDIVVRKSDGKRFRRMPVPSHKPSATAPAKPAVPSNVDLTSIRQQYQRLKKGIDISSSKPVPESKGEEVEAIEEEEEEEGDVYWEGVTTQDATPPPRPPKRPVNETPNTSNRISLIPEMSPEEEEGDLPVYDDTPIEDEDVYDDAMSERPNAPKPKTSISSEPQSPTETEQDRKKRLKEESNARKKDEKERKEKEKREREEEKKRKKKEEEELRLKTKFNLTGNEKMVGDGVIKADAKANGLNLKVKKGQTITIIRLDSNPPNKWLVKADMQIGYVDSQNIEIDPNIIRQVMLRYFLDSNCSLEKSLALLAARQTSLIAMTGQAATEEEDFDQPTYDDVPEDNGTSNGPIMPDVVEEEDDEQIYEFCE